ncbi:hypothetical protein Tco_1120534 [Tanacetum coccineum]
MIDDDDGGWPEVGRGCGNGSDDVDGDEVMKMVRVACHGDGGDESEGGVVRRLWWRRRWGRGDEVVAGGLGAGVAGVWPEYGRKNGRHRKIRGEGGKYMCVLGFDKNE